MPVKPWSLKEFVKHARIRYGYFFNYSKCIYKNSRTKIKIQCSIHGYFWQTPTNHLRGNGGCKECNKIKKRKSLIEIIKILKKIHSNKYNYSLIKKQISRTTIINIICPIHGLFKQILNNHIRGHGCPKCSTELHIKRHTFNNDIFIKRANKIHNKKYKYDSVKYKKCYIKVKILCNIHGYFWQTPISHINNKQGCPHCKISIGENIVSNWLIKNNRKYIKEKKFNNCKNKKLLSFDFYLPKENICIEYDGEQHFKPTNFGSPKKTKKDYIKQKKNDFIKNKYCKDNNIKLIRISYKNINNIEQILDWELNI